ncbi:hypothetical protein [Corynebacterium halotolerans]|uniref:Uncharacterized protein n=1 Tax=Corynebacterium halotolerans YIM 70093 = DSM 44683 TaxID=1121362 RepID=M1P033_9CORY|nr:hypothetical protein [Corynebacterium halotolerans]AGF73130.1 hypothetical protein A605_10650 [Corynebacterium halotolerans YIM 70093 = DSM 44683]
MDTPPLLPDWLAEQVDAGRTDLQELLGTSPFSGPALRTVAESGDFEVVDGEVRRVTEPTPATWFVQSEPSLRAEDPGTGIYSMALTVTTEMLADAAVTVPRAVAALLKVPRLCHRSLHSRLGPQAIHLGQEDARIGSIRRFLEDLGVGAGETVLLIFDRTGSFDVQYVPR